MVEIIIISALAKNDIIGKDNSMPWHLGEDFKRFKKLTLGHPVLMGRKTFESLPIKPLPKRENIILTRDKDYNPQGTIVFHDMRGAIEHFNKSEKIFIIGGANVYSQALEFADTLELTRIHKDFDGDTKFPKINFNEWKLIKEEKNIDEKIGEYSFLTYQRLRH